MDEDRTYRQRFTCAPESVRAARRFVLDHAGGAVDGLLALVVSELATNAVLHARTDFDVEVQIFPAAIRVEVHDFSPVLPVPKDCDPIDPTGRGMAILAQAASCWGVDPTPDGKAVWIELALERASRS